MEIAECLEALNTAYRDWCALKNFFVPVMKLTEKTRVGGKYRKRYDSARPPADRVLEWGGLDRKKAAWIRRQKRELNPFELERRVEQSLKKVFAMVREAREAEEARERELDADGAAGPHGELS